jgi:hypothetical protein
MYGEVSFDLRGAVTWHVEITSAPQYVPGGIVEFNRLVAEIDAEISRLQQAKALLTGHTAAGKRGPGRPKAAAAGGATAPSRRKRRLSPEGRRRIAEAMKKRWAERKKQQSGK